MTMTILETIPRKGRISLAVLLALVALSTGGYFLYNSAWKQGLLEGMQWYHEKCYSTSMTMIRSRSDGTTVVCAKGD